ncbi:NrsF family protein [Oscillatoria amoena NRMC-F 0135]|nr:NrsF family protein [Oscillatoria amoena NRMC-F 0135]
MKCPEVDRMLSEGVPVAEIRKWASGHLRICERCLQLLDLVDTPLRLPLDVQKPKLVGRMLENLQPASPLPGSMKIVGMLLGSITVVSLLWVLVMGAPGYEMLSESRRFALLLYAVVLAAVLAYTLARLLRPASPPPLPPALLLIGAVLSYPLLASYMFPLQRQPHFVAEGLLCLLFGLITSFLTSALCWRLISRGYRRNGLWTGATLGALGGLSGLVALQLVCTDQEQLHLSIWHGLVQVLSIGAGGAAGWLLTRRG